MAVDVRPLETLRREDLLPFAQAMETHVEAVMMAHVLYPAVDAYAASYSRRWIEEVLRGDLAFAGLVMSGDISMAAAGAADHIGARVRGYLDAGCDLVLACLPEVVDAAIAALQERCRDRHRDLTPLRGTIGASWNSLIDNPQRDRFIARMAALHSGAAAV
jgi:beta-N-acetylhexosaminidase